MDMDDQSDDDIDSLEEMDSYPNDNDSDIEVVPPPAAKLKSDSSTPSAMPTATAAPASPPKSKEKSFVETLLEVDVGDEPTENGAVVQFRMPDGKKLVRKFKKTDTVKIIYAFVAVSLHFSN